MPVADTTEVLAVYDSIVEHLVDVCKVVYGPRLVSLCVFGSLGRRTPRPDSDIDLLVIAEGLPSGRIRRVAEFGAAELQLQGELESARALGLNPFISALFKTPDEALRGSPLFLDMIEDGRILVDRDGFFGELLASFRRRLERLGARRVWRGPEWYWDLKPDYVPGEVFEL
jgi:predicted nucleotidyltransferase